MKEVITPGIDQPMIKVSTNRYGGLRFKPETTVDGKTIPIDRNKALELYNAQFGLDGKDKLNADQVSFTKLVPVQKAIEPSERDIEAGIEPTDKKKKQ